MDYQTSLDYLLSFADFERSGRFEERSDLAPVLALLSRLGDPHLGRTTAHIAGSKGKGSVAAMLESVLRAAGHSTGLYTSPHLHTFRERVRLNGEPVSEDEWASLAGRVREALEAVQPALGGRRFVTFDLVTALGFLAFRERAVACQVVEVGLGGRLDSTNVFEAPEVCAITAVGLEHTEVLGDTVEAIAAEKAGIIRPGATVVLGPQRHEEARRVVRGVAGSLSCRLVDVAAEYALRPVSRDLDGQRFRLERPGGALDLSTPLLGCYQLANAATAVACADALSERGLAVSDEAIVRGLADVSWPGRMEVLLRKPLVIADGAHSGDAAAALRDSLTHYLSGRRALFIVGVSAGKDAGALARELAPVAERVIAVRSRHPRALPAAEVAVVFAANGTETEIGGGVAEALDDTLATAEEETVICLTGSLFVVAEGRAHLRGIEVKA